VNENLKMLDDRGPEYGFCEREFLLGSQSREREFQDVR